MSRESNNMPTMYEKLVALLEREGARYRVIEHPAEGRSDAVAAIRGTSPGKVQRRCSARAKMMGRH
jgi:Ala-tRNA(Pro) deacylase